MLRNKGQTACLVFTDKVNQCSDWDRTSDSKGSSGCRNVKKNYLKVANCSKKLISGDWPFCKFLFSNTLSHSITLALYQFMIAFITGWSGSMEKTWNLLMITPSQTSSQRVCQEMSLWYCLLWPSGFTSSLGPRPVLAVNTLSYLPIVPI